MAPAHREFDPRDTAEALFGAELQARRVAAGFSLRQLAPLVLVSHDLLAKIEKAQRRPQPDVVDRLDDILKANGHLRRLAAPFTDFARPTRRRIVLEPDSAEFTLRDLIAEVRAADHTMAAEHLDEIVAYADAAKQVVARIGEAHRNPLLRLISEAHQLAGWMLFDRGSVVLAEKSFAAARKAAEHADALDLLAFVGGPNAGFMSTWTGDPGRGAERSYAALAWARRSGNRRLTAFVSTMAARAHAKMGEADLCTRMLLDAEAELSRHRAGEPDPVWLEVFDDAALAGHRGSSLLDLGQLRPAVDSLRQQDSASPAVFVRNRTIWQLEQAEAQLRMGEYEAAAVSLEQAMNGVATGSVTPRVLRVFRSIDMKLRACVDPAISDTKARLEVFISVCA
ncbi:helix-turn-helix domain-containing protein [Nocardia abscessus]|uniref:helix-turn-helix domain-containing protein n=1 Tax=Nocardia abscessus TaxID=120957 RepID=UPI001894BAB2|nr:helix-turn-helix transcriptional regulator [Nocardia abscessus]MBF6339786.1 helix-turn-helix domain-containing protein [Nocardia abscessus]